MYKYIYNIAILLVSVFISSCGPGTGKQGENKGQDKTVIPDLPPPVIKPVILSLDEIRKQFKPLSVGQAIDEFNDLKKKPQSPPLARETLDNYVETLLWKSFSIGGGQVAPDLTKFKVDGTTIQIEEGTGQWKKIDTDIEDRRALLDWAMNRNLSCNYHMFEVNKPTVEKINMLEQAVLWDDLIFVKNYFSGTILMKDFCLNNERSTPLAFATSVPMAQFLLDQGAKPDVQVRNIILKKDGSPVSVLEYLKATKAPQDVIDLVSAHK
jgi:hypothetical protein